MSSKIGLAQMFLKIALSPLRLVGGLLKTLVNVLLFIPRFGVKIVGGIFGILGFILKPIIAILGIISPKVKKFDKGMIKDAKAMKGYHGVAKKHR